MPFQHSTIKWCCGAAHPPPLRSASRVSPHGRAAGASGAQDAQRSLLRWYRVLERTRFLPSTARAPVSMLAFVTTLCFTAFTESPYVTLRAGLHGSAGRHELAGIWTRASSGVLGNTDDAPSCEGFTPGSTSCFALRSRPAPRADSSRNEQASTLSLKETTGRRENQAAAHSNTAAFSFCQGDGCSTGDDPQHNETS